MCVCVCMCVSVAVVDTGAGVADALPWQQAFNYHWSSL